MIESSYINTLMSSRTTLIYLADVIIILLAAFLIYRKVSSQRHNKSDNFQGDTKPSVVITSKDIRAIAGDDVMVTQLDLARAYIELGKKKLAKQILDHVIKHGNQSQQQSARQLMASF